VALDGIPFTVLPGQVTDLSGCQFALAVSVIVSTAVLQGRQHAALTRGFDPRILRRLVRSN